MSFTLNPTLAEAVAKQLCQVNVVFTATGTDIWVRPTITADRFGTKPHLSMTVEEATRAFSPLISRKTGGSPSPPLPTGEEGVGVPYIAPPHRAQLVVDQKVPMGKIHDCAPSIAEWARQTGGVMPTVGPLSNVVGAMQKVNIGKARNVVSGRGLDVVTSATGVKNSLPESSLARPDIENRNVFDLFVRMVVVANNLGNQAIAARVRSDQSLRIEEAGDLKEWWLKAGGRARLTVLSTAKKLNPNNIPEDAATAVAALPCPFRGSASALVIPGATTSYGEYEEEASGDDLQEREVGWTD